jgi:hypothetical protein
MASIIKPGFRGYAEIHDAVPRKRLRFNTCSLNAVQEIEAPDMVMGDDTHDAWAYGKIEVSGTISGPVTESTGTFIDALEAELEDGVQIDVKYYAGFTRAFSGCRLNSFTFNVSAGEVVNFSLEIIGVRRLDADPDMTSGFTKGEKLVTWDKASIRIGTLKLDEDPDWDTVYDTLSFETGLQAFTFTASNGITRQFILGESDLFGDLVEGMKSVTGNISSYVLKSSEGLGSGVNYWDQYQGDYAYPIRFDIGANLRVTAAVRFHRGTTELGTGPVVTTIGFTGVTTHGRGEVEQVT